MAGERVDKGWQNRGIDTYSLEALFGTLAHYGVKVDEAGFKASAALAYPLAIAREWHQTWKGTGQFTRFPASAAEELWRRLLPGRVAPTDVALALMNLVEALVRKLEGRPDEGMLETRFKVVEAYVPGMPEEGAPRRADFEGEIVVAMGGDLDALEGIAESLAEKNESALADRFVAVQVALFPVRRGVVQAMVQASRGDRPGAVAALVGITQESGADGYRRLSAIDGLFALEAFSELLPPLDTLITETIERRDVELGMDALDRVVEILEQLPPGADRRRLLESADRLEALI